MSSILSDIDVTVGLHDVEACELKDEVLNLQDIDIFGKEGCFIRNKA